MDRLLQMLFDRFPGYKPVQRIPMDNGPAELDNDNHSLFSAKVHTEKKETPRDIYHCQISSVHSHGIELLVFIAYTDISTARHTIATASMRYVGSGFAQIPQYPTDTAPNTC